MGFDLDGLRAAVAEHGRVVRVVIADLRGSSPREVGAAMLVWDDKDGGGQSGTIGGGTLEYEAACAALGQTVGTRISRHALGPDLGQCCGGTVTLLSEVYQADSLPQPQAGVIARPVSGPMPISVQRILTDARGHGARPEPQLIDSWMVEPEHRPSRQIWIWGAGHVGRALVSVLAPLPEVDITWVDTGHERFPGTVPQGVTTVPVANPADLVAHSPAGAEHLIVTYSHALDLELCHRLLLRGFGFAGLIGSKTKWARFRARLVALGHAPGAISRITCPIGDPNLGKHPQAIALGVAAQMLQPAASDRIQKDKRA